jgi:hypothetical protein
MPLLARVSGDASVISCLSSSNSRCTQSTTNAPKPMHAFRSRRMTDNPDSLDGGRQGDSKNRCIRNRNGCDARVPDTEEEATAGAPQHHQHTWSQSVVVELLHRHAVLQLLSRQSARCARNVVMGLFRSVIFVVRVVGGMVTSVGVSCSRTCPLLIGRVFAFSTTRLGSLSSSSSSPQSLLPPPPLLLQ